MRFITFVFVLGVMSSTDAQTITKGIQFNTQSSVPCIANTSCMWIDTANNQVQFFDGTTAKTIPSIVTSTKGDMAIFDGTKWQKLPVGTNGQALMADSGESTGIKWSTVTGTGTVTSVTCGTGLSCTPNPITAAGTISLSSLPTLASVYNDGAAPADSTMTLNSTAGGVRILDSFAGLTDFLFRVAVNDDSFQYINVNPSTFDVQFGLSGGSDGISLSSFGAQLGTSALGYLFALDNAQDIGSTLNTAAHVYTSIVSANVNTLALIGNGDQVNLSSTGFDPNVDIVTTLGTILKRYLSFAVKSGTIYFNGMGTTSTFGEGLLLRGTALTLSTPGSGVAEYSPMVEFQASFGQTSDPESGYETARWGLQSKIVPTTTTPAVGLGDRLAILSDGGTGTYVERASFISTGLIVPTAYIGASGSLPTCDVTTRGGMRTVFAAGGASDTFQICMKSSADAYAWRTVFTAP